MGGAAYRPILDPNRTGGLMYLDRQGLLPGVLVRQSVNPQS